MDAVFVAASTFATLSRPPQVPLALDYPLDVAGVRLADEPRLRADIAAVQHQYPPGTRPSCRPRCLQVLDAADHERTLLQVSTTLVAAQLALLTVTVLQPSPTGHTRRRDIARNSQLSAAADGSIGSQQRMASAGSSNTGGLLVT